MRAQFIKNMKPLDSMDLGKKVVLILKNGYGVEGFLRNKAKAELLIKKINKEMSFARKEGKREGNSEDYIMDLVDEVFFEYKDELKELGFELTEY
jgi:hypothetical protein